jgi:methylase of polypeptide subunit release factors
MLAMFGAHVTTSDVERYERDHNYILDFINSTLLAPAPFDAIITNPPYGSGNRMAVNFTRVALSVCNGWVAMLLTAKFDWGSTRVDMFRDCARFHKKIVLIDRLRFFDGPDAIDGTEDHAWFIWRPADHVDTLAHVPPVIAYEGNPYK